MCCVYRTIESFLDQPGQAPAMVNMRVRQYDAIDFFGIEQKLPVIDQVVFIVALKHTAIEQYLESIMEGNQMAATGYLSGGAAKLDLHIGLVCRSKVMAGGRE